MNDCQLLIAKAGEERLHLLLERVCSLGSARPTPPQVAWTVGLILVERLLTFGYFVPQMLHLMADHLAASDAVATALRWSHGNHLRHLLLLLGWLAALKAAAMFHRRSVIRQRADLPPSDGVRP